MNTFVLRAVLDDMYTAIYTLPTMTNHIQISASLPNHNDDDI
jgi:hypothetical protein